MPTKPTQPFGSMLFGKDGTVEPNINVLARDKQLQESEVASRFAGMLNLGSASPWIQVKRQLEEADQDFLLSVSGAETELQLTELVDREFLEPMSADDYDELRWTKAVAKSSNSIPLRVNLEAEAHALKSAVERKVAKHYSTTAGVPLWLLVFSTYPYETEFFSEGVLCISAGLSHARRHLALHGSAPFSMVWFFNLQTRPLQVWPCAPESIDPSPSSVSAPASPVKRSIFIPATAMQVGSKRSGRT